jgi:hypothetical protein
MPRLNWYYWRLNAMSFGEIVGRVITKFRILSWKCRFYIGNSPKYQFIRQPKVSEQIIIDKRSVSTEALLVEAESYLNHEWHFFGAIGCKESTIDWHRDPFSGKSAPRSFSFDINHRNEKLVGNIKAIWEKNRHHHLTVMASAYAISRDERFAHEVITQLHDWIDKNPIWDGVNWSHPLEHGIRLISWVWVEKLLVGSIHYDKLFNKDSIFWRNLYHHMWFIRSNYSIGTSANNHLIGEMAGLYVAARHWPLFVESEEWAIFAREQLEKEAIKQTFTSGINKEMAFSYQIFVIEFLLCSWKAAVEAGDKFSNEFISRLRRMIEVVTEMTDFGGNLPNYGDGDEGMAIQLQGLSEPRDKWIQYVGAQKFNCKYSKHSTLSIASCLFLSQDISDITQHEEFKPSTLVFDDAHLIVLSHNRDTNDEVFCLFDAGRHGYLNIAAHAHADALHFTLSIAGIPFIVDTGTFAYHTDQFWRKYFRGTSAHNTITIDSADQSEQLGAFLWGRKAQTKLVQFNLDERRVTAEHDGYMHLGITHRRHITLNPNSLILVDQLIGDISGHKVRLFLHFHPDCDVKMDGSELVVFNKGIVMRIPTPTNTDITLTKAADMGWYSERFNKKIPTYTVIYEMTKTDKNEIITRINFKKESI